MHSHRPTWIVPAVLLVLASSAAGIAASAQDPRGGQEPGGRPERDGGAEGARRQSALRGHMSALESGLEALTKGLEADDAEENVAALIAEVCKLERVSLDAKDELPRSVEALEGGERERAIVSFRTQMHGLTNALFATELHLLENDVKKAKKSLNEFAKLESKGHGEFKRGGRGR